MAKMRIGPLSEVHFSRIKERLEAAGASFERIEDSQLLEPFKALPKRQGFVPYPTFSGLPEFIYIEIEKEHILLIKQELDQIGIPTRNEDSLDEAEEWLCPKCDFLSPSQQLCPTHRIPLLEFSIWIEKRRKIKQMVVGYIFLFILITGVMTVSTLFIQTVIKDFWK